MTAEAEAEELIALDDMASGGPAATAAARRWTAIQQVLGSEIANLSLVRMCAQAIDEQDGRVAGVPALLLPADQAAFVALAKRAGIERRYRYELAKKWMCEGAAAGVASVDPEDDADLTAVYRSFDADDLLLYVGISDDLRTRLGKHAKGSSWMDFAARSTVEHFPSRAEASAAEIEAIKSEHPLFNHQHNDTPEARQRLVDYLVGHGRADLLVPAVSRG